MSEVSGPQVRRGVTAMVTRDRHPQSHPRQEQLALDGNTVTVPDGNRARRAPGMTEEQLLAAVRKLARLCGWLTYHTRFSRGSEPGFPDLVLLHRRQQRVIFVELKTATGRLSTEQETWLAALAAAGQEVAVWRPADLPDLPTILRGDRRLDPHGTIELECDRDRSLSRARENRRW